MDLPLFPESHPEPEPELGLKASPGAATSIAPSWHSCVLTLPVSWHNFDAFMHEPPLHVTPLVAHEPSRELPHRYQNSITPSIDL